MKKLICLSFALFLAACAPTSPTETNSLPTPTREGSVIGEVTGDDGDITGDLGVGFGLENNLTGAFAAQVTGAVEILITGDGAYNCENNLYVIRNDAANFPQLTLILPQNASADSFELGDNRGDGSNATATLFLSDGRVFAGGVDGTLIVNSLATAPEQDVKGSFFFSADNGGESIEVEGVFDFQTSSDSSFCD